MSTVPKLATPVTQPLHPLEKTILEKQVEIEAWLRQQWLQTPPPVYSSVDVRNAGFKIAPIDTNLFSGGFNNINKELLPLCKQAMQATLQAQYPKAEKILLIPENHTRNTFYLENVATIFDILQGAGYHVQIGSIATDLTLPCTFTTSAEREIKLHPVTKKEDKLISDDFEPDLIFLNNDLSGGIPEILKNISQPIAPSPCLGWDFRLKSEHFTFYKKVAEEFAQEMEIDAWLVNPLFRNCGEVDFMSGEGMQCLQYNAEVLFRAINKKYQQYSIETEPYIIVKADAGSYGMSVMSVKSVEELQSLNRKQRTHMAKTKGKVEVSKVILQEGVHTFETWDNHAAEPVVYMIGSHVVGGFYRVNTKRGDTENLNSPGMRFESLAFADSCQAPGEQDVAAGGKRFYVYGVLARLAALASAREMQAIDSECC